MTDHLVDEDTLKMIQNNSNNIVDTIVDTIYDEMYINQIRHIFTVASDEEAGRGHMLFLAIPISKEMSEEVLNQIEKTSEQGEYDLELDEIINKALNSNEGLRFVNMEEE